MSDPAQPAPLPIEPDPTWAHRSLFEDVREALYALPTLFTSPLQLKGIIATDLFSLSASLGATIESQVVDALNAIRATTWDRSGEYVSYEFVRQPQTFPDVLLRAAAPEADPPILMGIELKGWYALAKEREPSARFKVTPAVCAPQDLLVVFPWALSEVISGSPRLFRPHVIGARHAAEYRNWWWQHDRESTADRSIAFSAVADPYPRSSDPILDVPASDGGGNFGRHARTGLMKTDVDHLFESEDIAGIPLGAWQRFLSVFTEGSVRESVFRSIERLHAAGSLRALSDQDLDTLRDHVIAIADMLEPS